LLGLAADAEGDVEAHVAVRGHQDAAALVGLEPRDLPGEVVGAGDEVAKGVAAARLGLPPQLDAGPRVLENERDAGDGSRGGIENRSGHRAVEALRLTPRWAIAATPPRGEGEGNDSSVVHSALLVRHGTGNRASYECVQLARAGGLVPPRFRVAFVLHPSAETQENVRNGNFCDIEIRSYA